MKSKRFAKPVTGAIAAIAAMALVVAVAQATTPATGYEEFAGCPSHAENALVKTCVTSEVTGGHFQMGSKDVPITEPITLSGGVTTTGGFVFNSQGGLTPAKQTVPGGLVGLTGLEWLTTFLTGDALKVYAVTELAGTPENPVNPTFKLPIKVHLVNPVLGNNCYVGSSEEPIALVLTRGTTEPPPPNEPISGQKPTQELDPTLKGVVRLHEAVLVDNSFAAPAAKGCQLNLGLIHIGIDSLVNATSGLPSAAGTNETIQEGEAALVSSKFVYPPSG
jgi:hypothetical protein